MSQTALRESREKGEWKSRVGQISLKARGGGERQCEPVGTWRKQVKRSLLLSTATRRGLAGACLSRFPYSSGVHPFFLFSPYPSGIPCPCFSSPIKKRTKHRLVLSMFSHILPQLTDSNAMQLGYAGLRYFHNLRNLVHIQFFHII